MSWEVAARKPSGGHKLFRTAANSTRVCVACDRFDHSALLLGAIEFFYEALHVKGLNPR